MAEKIYNEIELRNILHKMFPDDYSLDEGVLTPGRYTESEVKQIIEEFRMFYMGKEAITEDK